MSTLGTDPNTTELDATADPGAPAAEGAPPSATNGARPAGAQAPAASGADAGQAESTKADASAANAPETSIAEALEKQERIEELERLLEETQSKADENWNQFLRARAETENVRRRGERDIANAHKFAVEKLVAELLPVADSLEMAVSASREEGADARKILEGVELTLKMLSQAFGKFNVEGLDPRGERFDPEVHEAMATQPSSEAEPNTVLQVIQKGYLLNQRLVRPALVIVSRAGDQ